MRWSWCEYRRERKERMRKEGGEASEQGNSGENKEGKNKREFVGGEKKRRNGESTLLVSWRKFESDWVGMMKLFGIVSSIEGRR